MSKSTVNIRLQLETLLSATRRPNTDKLLRYISRRGFFTAPCAPHHDFKGGLAWHSMEVILRMSRYSRTFPIDSIVVVSILHSFKDISKIRATGFELKPEEEDAMMLPSPLGETLEKAIHYSRRNPMDAEDLQCALAGKPRTSVRMTSFCSANAIDRRPIAKRNDITPTTNAAKPGKSISYDELVELLRGHDLDVDMVRETLNNNFQAIYPYYSPAADNAQRKRLDEALRILCPTGDTRAIVRLIFSEEKQYFNQNAKRSMIYEQLVKNFGYKRGYDAFVKLAPSKPR